MVAGTNGPFIVNVPFMMPPDQIQNYLWDISIHSVVKNVAVYGTIMIGNIMDKQTSETIIAVVYFIYSFAIIALATYMVAVYDWSLWTYLGFALFTVSIRKSD